MKTTKSNAESKAEIEQVFEDKEDMGLLMMMLEVDRHDLVSREDVMEKLISNN